MPPRIALAKTDHHIPGICRDVGGRLDQIGNDRAEPAPFRLGLHGIVLAPEGLLTDHPQDVVSHNAKFDDEPVGFELRKHSIMSTRK